MAASNHFITLCIDCPLFDWIIIYLLLRSFQRQVTLDKSQLRRLKSVSSLEDRFATLDVNADGVISREEYLADLERNNLSGSLLEVSSCEHSEHVAVSSKVTRWSLDM
ncbi:hypothetical protein P879_09841 [Paragonimus westermani]|uniref:EF-hand domain-containing protein n=1 Tax=Paragonimus westermani TaxID=34504 RepID=A0A8T0DML0_9TREM|nr:hypothetical protein P879_09841 [Paragonimus westermani]